MDYTDLVQFEIDLAIAYLDKANYCLSNKEGSIVMPCLNSALQKVQAAIDHIQQDPFNKEEELSNMSKHYDDFIASGKQLERIGKTETIGNIMATMFGYREEHPIGVYAL